VIRSPGKVSTECEWRESLSTVLMDLGCLRVHLHNKKLENFLCILAVNLHDNCVLGV